MAPPYQAILDAAPGICFFFFWGAQALAQPFMPPYLSSVAGLDKETIGLIMIIPALSNLIFSPIWGGISDRFQKPGVVLIASAVFSTVFNGSFAVLPAASSAWLFALVLLLANFFRAAAPPLLDSAALNRAAILNPLEEPQAGYAQYRLWGAVGWGGFSFILGVAASQDASGLRILFVAHIFIMAFAIGACALIDHTKPSSWPTAHKEGKGEHQQQQQEDEEEEGISFSARVALLLRDVDVLLFFAVVLCMGLMTGLIQSFLLVFLGPVEDGGVFRESDTIEGAVLAANCAAEVPLMAASGWIIERMGKGRVLGAASLVLAARLAFYALLAHSHSSHSSGDGFGLSPWLVLPVETLHGFGFGVAWIAVCGAGRDLAPPSLRATVQGLVQGIWFGLGPTLACLIGGRVYQRCGAATLFGGSALVAIPALAVLAAVETRRRERSDFAPAVARAAARAAASSGEYTAVVQLPQSLELYGSTDIEMTTSKSVEF